MYICEELTVDSEYFLTYLAKKRMVTRFREVCKEYDSICARIDKLEERASKGNYPGLQPPEQNEIDKLDNRADYLFSELMNVYCDYAENEPNIAHRLADTVIYVAREYGYKMG